MPEDNMNELISNWSSMSMEDLGTSLLARKSVIEKAAKKKAKRDEKIGMAMGVLMAGQTLFANSANKRIKEQEKSGKFSKARSLTQLPELNQAGSIYAIMEDLEDEMGFDPNGIPFKLNEDNIVQILDENPEFQRRMTSVLHKPIYEYFVNNGGKIVADDENVFEPIKAEILGPISQNLLKTRDVFKTGGYQLFPELEGQDIKTLWERLSGMQLNELDEIKIRQLDDRMESMRQAGTSVFSLGQWKNLFHKIGLAKEPSKVVDPITGKETELVNIWKHLKDQPLPIEQVLKELNLTQNITESIQTIYATTSARGFEAHAKRFVKENEIISGMLETDKLQNLQHSAQIETGIRGRRRGLRILRKSPLRLLSQEINNPLNSDIKNKLELKTAELYLRLKDPREREFNKAFFDGTEITDETKLLNAALSYTLGVTVKDMRTVSGAWIRGGEGKFGTERPLTRPRERGGEWRPFKDVRNFEYDFDTIERTVKRPFKVEDGQFKAEQYFYGLKPISQLDAVKDEFDYIMSKTNLSDADKKILTERLVVDARAANSANLAYDFDPAATNEELIDSFNTGLPIEEVRNRRKYGLDMTSDLPGPATATEILERYSDRFRDPTWQEKRRIGYSEGGLFGLRGLLKKKRALRKDRAGRGLDDEWSGPLARFLKSDVARKIQSKLPQRFSGTNFKWAMLDAIRDTADRTAEDFEKIENEVLLTASINSIKKGLNQVGYDDFKTGHSTSPVGSLAGYANIDLTKPRNIAATIKELRSTAEGDAQYNLSTTLGTAQIERDDEGVYWIKDRYNFNRLAANEGEVKSWGLAALALINRDLEQDKGYGFQRALMGAVGSEEGEGAYVNIRLGNAQELGLKPKHDASWTKLYGDKKWISEKPHGQGFFSGLDQRSMETDLAKLAAFQKGRGQASAEALQKKLQILPEYSDVEIKKPGITVNKPIPQPSLLKKDDDKVLGRSLFGMPYIKNIPSAE
jgi:hypothetical protein